MFLFIREEFSVVLSELFLTTNAPVKSTLLDFILLFQFIESNELLREVCK
jgi:hypothetical protein